MKCKPILVVMLVPLVSAVLETGEVRGQGLTMPQTPSSTIPLESSAASNPPMAGGMPGLVVPSAPVMAQPQGKQSPVNPSMQSEQGEWGANVTQLRNPYSWSSPYEKGRLFGHYRARMRAEQAATLGGAGAAGGMAGAYSGAAESGMGAAGAPGAGGEAAPGAGAAAPATAADAFATAEGAGGPGFGGGQGASGDLNLSMIGDQSPFRFHTLQTENPITPSRPVGPGQPPGPRPSSALFPSVRNFKISENQSPRPQDRIFYDFNYYNNLNATLDRRDQVPLANMKAYRHLWGFEKTFNDGKGSFGMRLPLNTLTADSPNQNLSTPTSTALGDLTLFGKYILEQNVKTGSLVSVGMAITPTTAGTRFAGAPYVFGLNTTYLQPFIGFIYNAGRLYFQGFTALDAPTSTRDVTMLYNDIGMGYYVYRSADPTRLLSAVVPTFEVHVNNPLNHRDVYNRFDIAGSPDVVNLTYGLNFQFQRQAVMTFALITPVSSPKPFDAEAALLFNWYYGRTRGNPVAMQPPVVQ